MRPPEACNSPAIPLLLLKTKEFWRQDEVCSCRFHFEYKFLYYLLYQFKTIALRPLKFQVRTQVIVLVYFLTLRFDQESEGKGN
ncbi:MAG: hypothetical protein CMN32_00200 [Saprospirales bacterium]|nr:hypothetical protein [Saprospirales bacterium]